MSIIQYGHRVLSQAHGTQRRRPGQVGRAQTRHRQLQVQGKAAAQDKTGTHTQYRQVKGGREGINNKPKP